MNYREILGRYSPTDVEYIIRKYLSAGQVNPDFYLETYQLYVLKDLSIPEIARHLDRTVQAITNRIDRLSSIVLANPIMPNQKFNATELLNISVNRLPLSKRSCHCLIKNNIMTVGEILRYERSGQRGLFRIKSLGRKMTNEIMNEILNLTSNSLIVEEGQDKYEILRQQLVIIGNSQNASIQKS